MAQRGAHLQAMSEPTPDTIDNADLQPPSIFEVIAQDSLMNSVRPALRFIFKYLNHIKPSTFGMAVTYYDEAYTICEAVFQNYYLKCYGASLAENFYGLKRIFPNGTSDKTARLRSLASLVLGPYLKLKLDALYAQLKLAYAARSQPDQARSYKDKLCMAFLTAYPILSSAFELWSIALQVGYLLSKCSVHSPWLWLSGARLVHATADDFRKFSSNSMFSIGDLPLNAGLIRQLLHFVRRIFGVLFRLVSKMIGFSLFFLQFLDYWYSQEAGNKTSLTALSIPRAPQKVISESSIAKMDPGLCPLCTRPRKSDTVLPISGYSFCYVCISKYIQTNHCCPVTKLPASLDQLVRLFVQT